MYYEYIITWLLFKGEFVQICGQYTEIFFKKIVSKVARNFCCQNGVTSQKKKKKVGNH